MSGDQPGHVPPDRTSTVEFARPAPPAEEGSGQSAPAVVDPDATAPDPPREAPAPGPDDKRIAGPPAGAPPAPAQPVHVGPAPKPPRATPGAWPQRFAVLLAVAAAALVMAVALAAVSLFSGGGSDGDDDTAPGTRTPASAKASKRPASGAPATKRAGTRPAPPVGTVVTGNGVTYQIVEKDDGYYEGRFTITNRTGRPMTAWRLSFDAPGADVRNVWDARLVRAGAHPVIENADGADPIPPGGALDVQFGASGAPAMPGACLLNGAACGL
ncbi:hypothetical protein F8568_003055 [Actinomadura sp. LD22]|uniref:CBM2 domain-containing protein n=1 Tax=Actinomadura physcomitrii TaxID=2650748 RepID=A0A6I4M2S1_9ACTN|nr:cellulose binding domain-containing protein [Actinomadura physcomitrii]MVZ99379.1 hypothetical protein [Actinomadura physcomitrii]